jgi:hypothetical protein
MQLPGTGGVSGFNYVLVTKSNPVTTCASEGRVNPYPNNKYPLPCTTTSTILLDQGSGNTYRGLLFLVCLGCGQLTGIQERSKTVIWYYSTYTSTAKKSAVFKEHGSASGCILAHRLHFRYIPVILLSVVLYWNMRQ